MIQELAKTLLKFKEEAFDQAEHRIYMQDIMPDVEEPQVAAHRPTIDKSRFPKPPEP